MTDLLEYDATVEYKEFDKCLINGRESIYLFNASKGVYEWTNSDTFKLNISDMDLIKKPSIMTMLKEFVSIYDRQPNEMEERLLIEQFKAEFNHWSKNV